MSRDSGSTNLADDAPCRSAIRLPGSASGQEYPRAFFAAAFWRFLYRLARSAPVSVCDGGTVTDVTSGRSCFVTGQVCRMILAWDSISHASITIHLHKHSPPAERDTSRDTSGPGKGSHRVSVTVTRP